MNQIWNRNRCRFSKTDFLWSSTYLMLCLMSLSHLSLQRKCITIPPFFLIATSVTVLNFRLKFVALFTKPPLKHFDTLKYKIWSESCSIKDSSPFYNLLITQFDFFVHYFFHFCLILGNLIKTKYFCYCFDRFYMVKWGTNSFFNDKYIL